MTPFSGLWLSWHCLFQNHLPTSGGPAVAPMSMAVAARPAQPGEVGMVVPEVSPSREREKEW